MSQRGLPSFSLSSEELRIVRALTQRFGTSYFWATLFFPRSLRHATFVLYAFFRIPDEYVDMVGSQERAIASLRTWRDSWRCLLSGVTSCDHVHDLSEEEWLVLRATQRVFESCDMPHSYADAFLDAMEQDLTVDRYARYADLERYMYGSAAVVGLMMTELIGYSDDRALHFAQRLGEAMQLTNFLRDMGEDWDERGRVYIPEEDLERFHVTLDDIAHKRITPAFLTLMQFEIARARALYVEAEQGIALLRPEGRRPVRAALVLYRAILDEIEYNHYNVLTRRARTSAWRKVQLLIALFLKK